MSTSTSQAPSANAENPWPGLASFTEDVASYFHGRSSESEALFRLIKREMLTVLFGQSGLGKTSLLQAGLFPLLRSAHYWPIYIRLDQSSEGPPPSQQVRTAIEEAMHREGIDSSPPRAGETLWEYFHQQGLDFWTAQNYLVTPVLVFDQFEEFFTLGRRNEPTQSRGREFLVELADLVENRPPKWLKDRLDGDAAEDSSRFDFATPACKVVISLREDYLPEFEGLRSLMRSIMHNRMRMTRMTSSQAREAVEKPGADLLEDGVAEAIVRFVAAATFESQQNDGAATFSSDELEVEPALLSLLCSELNNKRRQQGMVKISAGLLTGNQGEILSDYYKRSMAGIDRTTRRFVEDRLLTKSGYRDTVAVEVADEAGVTRESLEILVKRRLLRLEEKRGAQRIELTHDILAAPVKASREEEELAEARRQLTRARTRIAGWAIALLCTVLILGTVALHWRRLSLTAEASRLSAVESGYEADMRVAEQAVHEGDIGRALRFLDLYVPHPGQPDLRGFEWRLLQRLCQGQSLSTFHGHVDQVRTVAFSPDADLLVSGGADSELFFLDPAHQQELTRWHVDGPGITSVAFSPDRRTLACATGSWKSASVPGLVYLWKLDGKDPHSLSAAQNPSRRLLGHTKALNSVAFSPNGSFIATGSEDNRVMLWKTEHDRETLVATLNGHSYGINGVVFSPDSRILAAGCGDGYLQIWNVDPVRSEFDAVVQVSGIMSLAFSPDGGTLLIGSRDGPILFWDVKKKKVIDSIDGDQGLINSIAFTADGKSFATGGSNGTISLWNFTARRRPLRLAGHRDIVFSLAFSPRDAILASGCADRTVKIWDRDGTPALPAVKQKEGAVSSLAFSPDGSRLATSEGTFVTAPATPEHKIHVWKLPQGEEDFGLSGHQGIVHSVVFSPDGKQLASAGADKDVIVWDLAGRKQVTVLRGHTAPVLCVCYSPDGRTMASGSRDQIIRLWKTPATQALEVRVSEELKGHAGWVRALAFSPDGRLLASASSDRTVRLWDAHTRTPLVTLEGFEGACNSVQFSPDGTVLATCANDRTVRLWNVNAALRKSFDVVTLPAYSASINSLAFSPDGQTLAGGSQDSLVILWNVLIKKEVAFTAHRGGVLCVSFAPDGNMLATGSNDQSAILWYAQNPREGAPSGQQSLWSKP